MLSSWKCKRRHKHVNAILPVLTEIKCLQDFTWHLQLPQKETQAVGIAGNIQIVAYFLSCPTPVLSPGYHGSAASGGEGKDCWASGDIPPRKEQAGCRGGQVGWQWQWHHCAGQADVHDHDGNDRFHQVRTKQPQLSRLRWATSSLFCSICNLLRWFAVVLGMQSQGTLMVFVQMGLITWSFCAICKSLLFADRFEFQQQS